MMSSHLSHPSPGCKSLRAPAYEGKKEPREGLALHVGVRFATRHPLAALEPPVVWVGQDDIHKNIVVSRGIQTRNIKT